MSEQEERSCSDNGETDGLTVKKSTDNLEDGIGDAKLISSTITKDTGLKNQNLRTVEKIPPDLSCIEKQDEDEEQLEHDFASDLVSNVLEKVVKQLALDHSDGQGDTVSRDHVGASDFVDTAGQGDLNQGTGDQDKSSLSHMMPSDLEPIFIPTEENYTMEKYAIVERQHDKHDEQMILDEDDHDRMKSMMHKMNLSKGFCDDQKWEAQGDLSIPDNLQKNDQIPAEERYLEDRLHEDSGSQMFKSSNLSSGVLQQEMKIPSTLVNPYCPNHLPGSVYLPRHPRMHDHNLQLSQSYPCPTHHRSHHQTISPRLSPSQRLMWFPKLQTSSATTRRKFLSSVQRRQKLPAAVARMSAVMTNTRERTEKQRLMSSYYEERSPSKLLSLDQCINSRPPMPFDLDTPGPCRYTPRNKPLHETNSPKYTFGNKYYERDGGGRTAWSKTWFNSENNFTTKANFEDRWPSPVNHSSFKSQIGVKLPTKLTYPSFTIGVKSKFILSKRGSEKEPSPNEYNPAKADHVMYNKAPAFSMTFRHRGTSLWSDSELSPAPDIYNPCVTFTSKPHRPAFTIQGIRRPKSHALGPHATF